MGKDKQKKIKVITLDSLNKSYSTTVRKIVNFVESASIKKLASLILNQCIADNASDLYMERTKIEVKTEYKIDNIKYEFVPPPVQIYDILVGEIRKLVGNKNDTHLTKIRIPKTNIQSELEAFVSLADISKSSLHLEFNYNTGSAP